MKLTLVTVGKLKERYLQEAVEEYRKRLGRYCRLELLQLADEKTPDGASQAQERQIREREGARILGAVKDSSYMILLAIRGKELSSEELAARLDRLGVEGISHITFVIGGSLGVSEAVERRADFALSISPMTFPHQLMRVILLEQIYRCYRINAGEPYHK